MTTLNYEITGSDNEGTVLDPIQWATIEFSYEDETKEFNLQYDCGDNWGFIDLDVESVLEEFNIDEDDVNYKSYYEIVESAIDESEPCEFSFDDYAVEIFGCTVKAVNNLIGHGYYNNTSLCVYESEDGEIFVGIWDGFTIDDNFIKFQDFDEYKEWLHSDKIWGNALDFTDFSITHRISKELPNFEDYED